MEAAETCARTSFLNHSGTNIDALAILVEEVLAQEFDSKSLTAPDIEMPLA